MNKRCEYILYGVPHSLYTGIARCYLRTQGISFVERSTAHPNFSEQIVPQIGRSIIPVLETPEGEIIQDSLDIIDYFERDKAPYPAYPTGPRQLVLAILIHYYGSQAMLRHAMHYRWSYRNAQEGFLLDAFSAGGGREIATKIMARMNAYLPHLGVTGDTIPAIEQSYETLLDILELHFRDHPYLFGGQPSVADYGLIGPMFAHLGRDPVPSQLMKVRSPRVYRWVERMTAPGLDTPEFLEYGSHFLNDDNIPRTLEPLLTHISAEIFPELTDKLAFMDSLVQQQSPADGEPVSDKPHQRNIGVVDTNFCGIPTQAGVAPYVLYLLRRTDKALACFSADEQQSVRAYLAQYGLDKALPGERGYSVDRRNNIEVWER